MEKNLTPSEARVLRALEEAGEATATALHAALAKETEWAHATVVTFLRRLEKKGMVKHRRQKSARAFLYRPAPSGGSAGARMARQLVDRVFGGNPLPLMATMLEERPLTEAQLEELRTLLDKHVRERKDA